MTNFLCQSNSCSTVGCYIDAWDALCPGKLRSSEKQQILLGSKGPNSVSDVIANNNDISAVWIFWTFKGHFPSYHANLQRHKQTDKKHAAALRRSGLVLDDPALLEAWEKGEDKRYIPVKFTRRKDSSDSLASLERMGKLARHLKLTLTDMARELHRGSIAADPYYRSQQETACLRCDYLEACFFTDGEDGESCRYLPKLSDGKVWELMEKEGDHA